MSKINLKEVSKTKSAGGWYLRYEYDSPVLNSKTVFGVFRPSAADKQDCPVIYWLSGLTCNDENFMVKAGAHAIAEELGVILVAPDTSPRGNDVANDDAYDLGQGAGFYVNATQPPWSAHYRMYDFIVDELPSVVGEHLPVTNQASIMGHSMGGHGALTIALNEPSRYKSASAFSPIANPSNCPWGAKAFGAYLGSDTSSWAKHDAVKLLEAGTDMPALVSQGLADNFLKDQLGIDTLKQVVDSHDINWRIEEHPNYDHSYFFIASFIRQHLEFHASHFQ